MGTIFRPPLTLKVEPKDKAGIAIRAQADVDPGTDLAIELKGQDRIHRGPGQTTTYDYPNPRGPGRSISLWTFTYLALALTVVPFAQRDWPVPKGPAPLNRGWQDSFKLPLQTIRPNNQYNWPNPRGPARIDLTWIESGNALTAGVVSAPFAQFDWPNPAAHPFINFLRRSGTANTIALGLPGVPELGLTAETVRGPAFSVVRPDWIWSTPLNTTGTGAPELGLTAETVRGPSFGFARQDWIVSTPQTLSTIAPPFSETEWPNPRGPAPLNRGFTDSFKLPLQTIVGSNQYDWPNPNFVRWPIELRTWLQPGLATTTVRAPFVQADWPVPKGYAPTQWRGHTDSFKLPLQTIVGSNQYDWPNPRGHPPRQYWTDSFKLPLQTLRPSNQFDWPVPRGAAPTQWRGFTDSFKLPLQSIVGSNQYDWPNPRGYRRSIDLLTWIEPALQVTPAQGYNQYDWPVPKGRARLTALSWTDSFKLPLQTLRPNNQYQWPNPYAPRRITALGHTDRAQPGNIPAQAAPVSARFWPNPVLRVVRRQDYTQRNLNLLTSVTPQQPVTGLKLFKRHLMVSTTGPNIVLGYPFPPVPPLPPPPGPPKHGHGHIDTTASYTALNTAGSSGRIRSARSTTSSRWRKSRGRIRTGRGKTTTRDDP